MTVQVIDIGDGRFVLALFGLLLVPVAGTTERLGCQASSTGGLAGYVAELSRGSCIPDRDCNAEPSALRTRPLHKPRVS